MRGTRNEIERLQTEICNKYGAAYLSSPPDLKLGIAKGVWEGRVPINGLRHHPAGDTTGWFIWAGTDWSDDPDFFEPIHVGHVIEGNFEFVKYLGLGPGWRFLSAGEYEDVWFDKNLLASN
jgi:hypothetical protein